VRLVNSHDASEKFFLGLIEREVAERVIEMGGWKCLGCVFCVCGLMKRENCDDVHD
jgi:hypothetical protein